MDKVRRWAAGAAVLGLAAGTAWGGTGKSGAQFLKIGVGARALAMGGAYAAVTDDAHALDRNPAAASRLKRGQVASSYNMLYQDTSQAFLAAAFPTRIGLLGAGVNALRVEGIEKRAGDTASGSSFDVQDQAVFVSFAVPRVWSSLALGATLKRISLSADGQTGSALAADAGAFLQPEGSRWGLGLSVLNLGSDLKMGESRDPLPRGIKAGATYKLFHDSLLVSGGVDIWTEEKLTYAQMGLEWRPASNVALRTGPQMGGDRKDLGSLVGMSAGLGVRVLGMDVDYAYVPFGDLGNTNRLSLRWSFGRGPERDARP